MITSSLTAGGRKLPGGRARSSVLLLALLVSCAPTPLTAATPRATGAVPVAATASISPTGSIPTLGTTPPAGLILPSYFLTVTASGNGSLSVLTSAASACALAVRAPSGTTIDAGQRVADARGIATWTYAPLTEHGESILTATCALGDQTQTAKAQVLLP